MCMQRREAVAKQEEETVGGGGEGVCVLKTSKPPHQTNAGVIDMASLLAKVTFTALLVLRVVTKPRPWKLHPQMLIKRGCFMVLESYFRYFNSLSQSSDQGEVMHLLIEAIVYVPNRNNNADIWDGVACHVCGFKISQRKRFTAPPSNFFGLFYLKLEGPVEKDQEDLHFVQWKALLAVEKSKTLHASVMLQLCFEIFANFVQTLPRWVGMKSVTEAKSKIGQAVMMTLQVGVLEKFKSVPLVTGFDLACFAGAVFVSSACLFLLSQLSDGAGDATATNNIS
ncbi:unnamed protein product [Camellia sinensis]